MQAVVVRGVDDVAVEAVEIARIEASTDILLQLTSSAICGTDLHIWEGRMGDANPAHCTAGEERVHTPKRQIHEAAAPRSPSSY